MKIPLAKSIKFYPQSVYKGLEMTIEFKNNRAARLHIIDLGGQYPPSSGIGKRWGATRGSSPKKFNRCLEYRFSWASNFYPVFQISPEILLLGIDECCDF